MSRPTRALTLLAVTFGVALLLAGCGRKGALDPPPGGYQLDPGTVRTPTSRKGTQRQQEKAQDYDEDGRPIIPEGQKKPFILDPLIK